MSNHVFFFYFYNALSSILMCGLTKTCKVIAYNVYCNVLFDIRFN